MKKIESIFVLIITAVIFVVVLLGYRYTTKQIEEKHSYLENTQNIYTAYLDSTTRLYQKKDVEKNLQKILDKLNIRKSRIVKNTKKLSVRVENISEEKQDKLLNTILNEKFMIIGCHIEKNSVIVEIGL